MADEEKTVVTDDLYLRTPGSRHEDDASVLVPGAKIVASKEFLKSIGDLPERSDILPTPSEPAPPEDGTIPLTPELIASLRHQAPRVGADFALTVKRIMIRRRAAYVRYLRCDLRSSWRMVAATCHHAWLVSDWQPPSNQLMGMALCDAAAKFLNEDPRKEPWNDC